MHGPRWHGAAETKELSSDSPDGKDAGELGEVRAVPPTVGSCLEGGEKIPSGKKILQVGVFFLKQPGMVVTTRNLVTLGFPQGCLWLKVVEAAASVPSTPFVAGSGVGDQFFTVP